MSNKLYYDQLLDFYGELLSKSQQEIAGYYYREDLSLKEISELQQVSRAAVYDRLKRIRLELDHLESILHLKQKQAHHKQILETIRPQVNEEIWSILQQLETE